jgi:hypothetical protein
LKLPDATMNDLIKQDKLVRVTGLSVPATDVIDLAAAGAALVAPALPASNGAATTVVFETVRPAPLATPVQFVAPPGGTQDGSAVVFSDAGDDAAAGMDHEAGEIAASRIPARSAAPAAALSKEEALQMFETKNPARSNKDMFQIVEQAVELQHYHGTKHAAAFLEEHKVPLHVGKRVLLEPQKRRGPPKDK